MNRREFLKIASSYALLACAASGCSHKLVQSDNLIIQDGFTHPYTFLTEEEGEKRLIELASSYNTKAEESWLVFRTDRRKCRAWIDIGINQDEGHVDMCEDFVEEITDDLRKTVGPEKRIECLSYHPHIIRAVIRKLKELPAQTKRSMGLEDSVQKYHAEIISAPTAMDIAMHIDLKEYLQKKRIMLEQSRVVAPTGIFSYDSTPELERFYHNSGMEAMEFVRESAIFRGFKRKNITGSLEAFQQNGLKITYKRAEPERVKFPIKI